MKKYFKILSAFGAVVASSFISASAAFASGYSTTSTTTSDDGGVAALIFTILCGGVVFVFAIASLYAMYKAFDRAGYESPWHVFIPLLNIYVYIKYLEKDMIHFFVCLVLPIALYYYQYKAYEKMGYSSGMAVGSVLLPILLLKAPEGSAA